ncbi:MAG: hypothetical protein Q8L60_04995 [Gammaproteobacteria bacterium]|nr:hypothetical protein [Gammaproteobacteria bacterium]MDP2140758.1 hypothetical protein [Gammaproteobacteria bacterium]MDP2347012.1 hypothetical protein [Gammaproteobacteria bacterium]
MINMTTATNKATHMTANGNDTTIREAVGVFHGGKELKDAISELRAAGFAHEELGLLASDQVIEGALGDLYARTNSDSDAAGSPAIAFVNREAVGEATHSLGGGLFFVGTTGVMGAIVASSAILGGAVVAALGGIVAVGVAGALAATISHQSDAEILKEHIDKGHILLFVRMADPAREGEAMAILKKHSGTDVRMYDAQIRSCEPTEKVARAG